MGMAQTSSIQEECHLAMKRFSSICLYANPSTSHSCPTCSLQNCAPHPPFFSLNELSHPSLPPRRPTAFPRRHNPCSNCIPSASPSQTTKDKNWVKTRKFITYISNPSQSPAQSWATHPPHSARPCHPSRSNKPRYPCPFPSPWPTPRHPRPHAPSPARG